jgi:hypothetical protein
MIPLASGEGDALKVSTAINQLIQGRSNACGRVTLRNGQTTTPVIAPNCGKGACVFLFPATTGAAAVLATTYVADADVIAGRFTITHASAATARSFYWIALG